MSSTPPSDTLPLRTDYRTIGPATRIRGRMVNAVYAGDWLVAAPLDRGRAGFMVVASSSHGARLVQQVEHLPDGRAILHFSTADRVEVKGYHAVLVADFPADHRQRYLDGAVGHGYVLDKPIPAGAPVAVHITQPMPAAENESTPAPAAPTRRQQISVLTAALADALARIEVIELRLGQ